MKPGIDMIRSARVKLRDWLTGLLFLGVSLYLLHIYAKGQWEYTIQFLKSLIAQFFNKPIP